MDDSSRRETQAASGFVPKISRIASYIGVTLFLAVGVTQCIQVSKVAPDNAVVLVDDILKMYHAPIHFKEDGTRPPEGLREFTLEEAKAKGYERDPTCRNREYFVFERGSLLRATLSDWTGLSSQDRWNEDGTWNW